MDLDENNFFAELFAKLSQNINNYKSDYFIGDLISFLKIANSRNSREKYKYTIYFFITNREKISYLLNSKEKEAKNIDELKYYMGKFLKQDQEYFSTNEMFIAFFPEVFQNFRQNKNRNNLSEKNQLVINKQNTNENLQVENKKVKNNDSNNYKSKTFYLDESDSNNIEQSATHKTISLQNQLNKEKSNCNLNIVDNKLKKNQNEQNERLTIQLENSNTSSNVKSVLTNNENYHQYNKQINPSVFLQITNTKQVAIDNNINSMINHIDNQEVYPPSNRQDDTIKNSLNIRNTNPISSVPISMPNQAKQQKILNKYLVKINEFLDYIDSFNSTAEFLEDYIEKVILDNQQNKYDLFMIIPEKIELLPQEYIFYLLTIYSKFFFLFKEGQKKGIKEKFSTCVLIEGFADNKSIEIIKEICFYDPKFKTIKESKNPLPADFLLYTKKKDIDKDQIQKYFINLMKNCKEKEDVLDLFYILTINKLHSFINSDLQYKLLFFLFLILCKSQLFTGPDETNYLPAFYTIKFYNEDRECKFKTTLLNKNEESEITYLDKKLSHFGKEFKDCKGLFNEYEQKFCEEVIKTIKHFYKFENEIDLLNIVTTYRNFDFTMNIVELISKKEYYIYQHVAKYKNNLKELESFLYNNYTSFNKNLEFSHSLYSSQQKAYIEVCALVKKTSQKFEDLSVSVFPFGSVTQFLGSQDSDLDLYLHISGNHKDTKIKFLYELQKDIGCYYNIRNPNSMSIVTSRLITLTFTNNYGIKIDINYFGVCSVLNSSLLRVYSLIDTRFVILAYNLKFITKALCISNTDDKKIYLNSFCLMMLLVTFLQDIVSPPVLPKILQNSEKLIEKLESGNKLKKDTQKKTNYYANRKTFHEVVRNTSLKDFDLNYDFTSQYENIYKKFLKEQTVRNEMSLAELFLKFIEYLIFYFRYESVFAYCSFSPGEGFYSKSDLKKFDEKFSENFKYVSKKGDFLIREPFDHGYNPAQTMEKKNTEDFIAQLKNLYFDLIEKGKFI